METKYADCWSGLIKGNRPVMIFQAFYLNNQVFFFLSLSQGTFIYTIYMYFFLDLSTMAVLFFGHSIKSLILNLNFVFQQIRSIVHFNRINILHKEDFRGLYFDISQKWH